MEVAGEARSSLHWPNCAYQMGTVKKTAAPFLPASASPRKGASTGKHARARMHAHANANAETHTRTHMDTRIHTDTCTRTHACTRVPRGMRRLSRSPPLAPSAPAPWEDIGPRGCKVVWPGVSRAWRQESRSPRLSGEVTGRRAEQCLPAPGAAPAPVAHPPRSPTDAPILALRGNDILKAWSRPAPFSIARGW